MTTRDKGASPDLDELVIERGIPVEADIHTILSNNPDLAGQIKPELAADIYDRTEQPMQSFGANYLFYQVNYRAENRTVANRVIVTISQGERTGLMYRTTDALAKSFTVHRGVGSLVLAHSRSEETLTEPIGEAVNNASFTLEPDSFYTLGAAPASPEPMTVSGFYEPGVASWEDFEVEVFPGDHQVAAGTRRTVHIPVSFWEKFKDSAI